MFVETLCKGRGNFRSARRRASGQFGCGTNKNMRLAPASRLPSTFRSLHAKLGFSWTMRPALSPSITSLTMAPSSIPSLNVPLLNLYGPSSVLVLMMEEEMQLLLSSVLWRWGDRDPLTCCGILWIPIPLLLVPFSATDPPHFPRNSEPLCLCRGVRIPSSRLWQGSSLKIYISIPSTRLLSDSFHEINYFYLAQTTSINQNLFLLSYVTQVLFSPLQL